MKKVFISQPMRGKSDKEIIVERVRLEDAARKTAGEEIEILDSFFKDFNGNALGFLGKALIVLSQADIAVFGKDWQDARGCRIEHLCCKEYEIQTIEVDD